jgi:hypothetical protein
MNDEYLWNKTGTDADIEELENELKAFRFQLSEPPALPARVVPLPEKRRFFSFFRLGFAVAFAAAVIVAMTVMWLRTPVNHSEKRSEYAQNDSPNAAIPGAIRPEDPGTPIIEPPMPKPRVIKFRPPTTNDTRAVKVVAKKEEKLTPEEKHAYDQLMTALAITSNELKFVKDKIKGRDEERTSVPDRQK